MLVAGRYGLMLKCLVRIVSDTATTQLGRMNALKLRDDLFSHLHASLLQSAGFKKNGHWSTREVNGLHQTFYLRASRFGSQDHAVFWIDIQIHSPEWYELAFAPKRYTKPAESIPSLIQEELGMHCEPPLHTLNIKSILDAEALRSKLFNATRSWALPKLEQWTCKEEVLAYLRSQPTNDDTLFIEAGLLCLLGLVEEARTTLQRAATLAPHEKARSWIEQRAKVLLLNAA